MFAALNRPSDSSIGSQASHFSRGTCECSVSVRTCQYDTTLSASVATYSEFVTKSIMFHMSVMYSWNPAAHSCFTSLHISPMTQTTIIHSMMVGLSPRLIGMSLSLSSMLSLLLSQRPPSIDSMRCDAKISRTVKKKWNDKQIVCGYRQRLVVLTKKCKVRCAMTDKLNKRLPHHAA